MPRSDSLRIAHRRARRRSVGRRPQAASALIDISVPVSPRSIVWPGASPPVLERRLSMDRGDHVNDTNLTMNVHTGTHLDAPIHFFRNGQGADHYPLERMIGEAWVVEMRGVRAIDAEALRRQWPAHRVERVMVRTDNSARWAEQPTFTKEFAALTADAAAWLVERGVCLVGIDYLSIQLFGDPPTVHETLLGAGVVILEGLDLSRAPAGRYELLCLPLKLVGSDGTPARAVLRPLARGRSATRRRRP